MTFILINRRGPGIGLVSGYYMKMKPIFHYTLECVPVRSVFQMTI